MTQDRLRMIYDLSSTAWKWFKAKDETDVSERDDYFWETVTSDIKKMVGKCKDRYLKPFYTDLLNTYAGQLQQDYLGYLASRQEKLPL